MERFCKMYFGALQLLRIVWGQEEQTSTDPVEAGLVLSFEVVRILPSAQHEPT